MKYGIVTYHKRPMRKGSRNALNIGDPIQTYAMKYVLRTMSVPENQLVEISRYHASDYDGDYAVLPFNCFNMIGNQAALVYNTLPLSPKIIPVFISFHLHSRHINREILDNLRAYQPIGCRDEETMLNLRKHGLVAYLSGCVTALLPKRKNMPVERKAFFVDIPEGLLKYVPQEIKENAEYLTHQPQFQRLSEENELTDAEYDKFYEMGINTLKRYEMEATLVVTSRLHVATPCMAMGIPVILVSNNFDGRFSWIDKYLRLYTPDTFQNIDWYPEPVEYEEQKERLLHIYQERIKKTYEDNKDIYCISSYYESRNHSNYNSEIIDFLSQIDVDHESNINYALWGITFKTLTIKNIISDLYPNWRLSSIIDENTIGEFEGMKIINSKDIESEDDNILYFIIPKAAHEQAAEFLSARELEYVIVEI